MSSGLHNSVGGLVSSTSAILKNASLSKQINLDYFPSLFKMIFMRSTIYHRNLGTIFIKTSPQTEAVPRCTVQWQTRTILVAECRRCKQFQTTLDTDWISNVSDTIFIEISKSNQNCYQYAYATIFSFNNTYCMFGLNLILDQFFSSAPAWGSRQSNEPAVL